MSFTLDPVSQQQLLELATKTRAQATKVEPKKPQEVLHLEQLLKKRDSLREGAASAQMVVDDMELEIIRIQQDERKLRRRVTEGTKELRAAVDEEARRDLRHDIAAATTRINALTGEMQEAHNELHALRQNVEVHDAQLKEIDRQVDAAQRAVDAMPPVEQEDVAQRIAELREGLPADALAAFDEQRAINGVGVASFNGRTCGGCFIVLPAAEISAIKHTPANEMPQCPDCDSYLVFER